MAASAPNMEDHITCSVCFEIYRDPHALKCLHTFCLPCIQQFQCNDMVPCPECREITPFNNIKKDFKTSGFIEVYQQELSRNAAVRQAERKKSRQKSLATAGGTIHCEMCKQDGRPVKSKCMDCNKVMCENCALTHRGIPVCENHQVLPMKDAITNAISNLKSTLRQLISDKKSMHAKEGRITAQIDDIRKSHEKQIEYVNRLTDEIISELNGNRRNVNHAIFMANNSLVETLHKKKQVYMDSQVEMQENIDFLSELVASEDVSTLTESAITVDANVKYDVKKIKESLPNVDANNDSPVTVVKGEINIEELIKVKVHGNLTLTSRTEPVKVDKDNYVIVDHEASYPVPLGDRQFPECFYDQTAPQGTTPKQVKSGVKPGRTTHSDPSQNVGYGARSTYEHHSAGKENHHSPGNGNHRSPGNGNPTRTKPTMEKQHSQIVNFTYRWERSSELSFYPQRLCIVKNNVWIAGWDGVYVFNKNCQGVKTIKIKEAQMIRGLIRTHTGDIILACIGKHGLIRIDINGLFQNRIAEGSFTDICNYKKKIYALESEKGKIIVFEHMPAAGGWVQVKQFNNFKRYERVSVNNDTLYVSSREGNHIAICNLEGQILQQTGEKGSRKAGKLKNPLLCDVNYSGDALVADCDNHRLQIHYRSDGIWRIFALPGDLRYPVDSIIDDQANTIWMIKHEPSQLLKFSRKHASLGNLLDTVN